MKQLAVAAWGAACLQFGLGCSGPEPLDGPPTVSPGSLADGSAPDQPVPTAAVVCVAGVASGSPLVDRPGVLFHRYEADPTAGSLSVHVMTTHTTGLNLDATEDVPAANIRNIQSEAAVRITDDAIEITSPTLTIIGSVGAVAGIYHGRTSGRLSIDGEDVGLEEDVVCWSSETERRFQYDGEAGTCTDASGTPGRNPVPWLFVRGSGNGQCSQLSGEFAEDVLGYQAWSGLDLRGADLSNAQLHFAHLVDARLEAAIIDGFDFGYAKLTGTIDARTVLGGAASCVGDTPTKLACLR